MLNIDYSQNATQSVMLISLLIDPLCAWCLKERGLLTAEHQRDGESHGICKMHSDVEYEKFRASRLARQSGTP